MQNEGCLLLQLKYRNRNNSRLYGKNCSLVCIMNFMHCIKFLYFKSYTCIIKSICRQNMKYFFIFQSIMLRFYIYLRNKSYGGKVALWHRSG